MDTKALLNVANTLHATNIVGHNLKQVNKKQTIKSITKLGVGNIIGTEFVKLNAQNIGSL